MRLVSVYKVKTHNSEESVQLCLKVFDFFADKNNDKYQGIYDLITQRLRNLSQIDQENDHNIRKSFVPATTNKSNVKNTTVLLRNATQKNQINEQNSRRSYVPMAAGYTRNLVPGIPPGNQMAGNQMVGNQMAGNSPAGNVLAGNQPAGSPSSFGTDNTKQAFTNYLTNTEQAGASMFPTSSIASRISHEDRSGIFTNVYRPPSTNDRKNTIYRQNSPTPNYYGRGNGNSYGRISPPWSDVRRTGVTTPDQYTRGYQNYPQQLGHRVPNYQQYYSYTGYPGYQQQQQQQQWRRGYPASPGYQANHPGMSQQSFYPTTKEVRDRVPIKLDKKWSVASSPEDYENNFDDKSSPKPTTIQIKLPEEAVRKSTSPRVQSFQAEDTPSSGSESGYDEPADMDDTADLQETQEFSGSGSGYHDNEDLKGDTSNVAFMLAGTNHDRNIDSPSLPVPVLPLNLTKQQAIDIYKSALYFAGLLREGNINVEARPLTTLQRPNKENRTRTKTD